MVNAGAYLNCVSVLCRDEGVVSILMVLTATGAE